MFFEYVLRPFGKVLDHNTPKLWILEKVCGKLPPPKRYNACDFRVDETLVEGFAAYHATRTDD